MEIIVSARHFDLSESVRQHAVEVIEASFSDLRLKVSKATMVIDQQRNLIKAQLVVNIKEFQVEASSEVYDNMYKRRRIPQTRESSPQVERNNFPAAQRKPAVCREKSGRETVRTFSYLPFPENPPPG